MKKQVLILSSVLILGVIPAAPAFAGDGFVVSGGITSTTQEFNHTRNTGSNQPNTGAADGPSGSVVDKDTSIGFFGSAGYQKQFGNNFYGAVEAFYSNENSDTTVINNVLINETELNQTYGADLRLGINVSDNVGIYSLLSATAYDFDSDISYTFAPPMDAVSETEWALTYGAGVDVKLSDRVSTFGEVRIANDIDFDTPVDRGGIASQNELNFTIIRSGLRFHF